MLKWSVSGILLLAVAGIAYIRLAGEQPAHWHVDPATATPGTGPNEYLATGPDAVFIPLPPQQALSRLDTIAQADPRTTMIAGSIAAGHVTYVQRSAIIGFPDYISVRARTTEGGSSLSIYSRSRFGYSDLGVNKARTKRWLNKIDSNFGAN